MPILSETPRKALSTPRLTPHTCCRPTKAIPTILGGESGDIPTLVIRLDRLTEADHSAQAVGVRRELPDSPTITLGELAGDQPSVLCIDQLDALSIVSARQQSAWNALKELLDEARNYPNMRILFACRSFDLEQDAQLRALIAGEETVTRIRVWELSDDTIQSAIESSGLAVSPLDHQQMRLLSVPLHLYLFLEAARSGDFDFTSKGDLFDAFWRHKARNVNNRLGAWSSVWTETIAALCDVMSERESLVAPDYALDEWPEAIEAMASEAVVQVQDGEIRFFHESFFDYSSADHKSGRCSLSCGIESPTDPDTCRPSVPYSVTQASGSTSRSSSLIGSTHSQIPPERNGTSSTDS